MSFNNSTEQENDGVRHSDSASKKPRERSSIREYAILVLIIGVLAALAMPYIFRYGPHAGFANVNEVSQLSAAIELFNIDHGFYPPAIGLGLEVESAEDFLKYLDQMAPDHAEGTGVDGGGLEKWWTNVGRHLDERSSLVFWLSGLCNSKRYPLSGNANLKAPLAPYGTNKFFDDSQFTDATGAPIDLFFDRKVFFEFRQEQLDSIQDGLPLGIKGYNQPSGRGDSNMYEYRDFRSYDGGTSNSVLKKAYHNGVDENGKPNFLNPSSFQIVGPGLDGKMSDEQIANTNLADSTAIDPAQDDNITNFSGGRLDRSYN